MVGRYSGMKVGLYSWVIYSLRRPYLSLYLSFVKFTSAGNGEKRLEMMLDMKRPKWFSMISSKYLWGSCVASSECSITVF